MSPKPPRPGPSGHGAIYSTQHGKMCPQCSRPLAGCVCARMNQAAREAELDGIVRVGRETKGRKGAGVTVVHGIPGDPSEIKAVAKELKKRCGTGGTVKDGVVEIQGDHRDLIVTLLTKKGWTVKKSGG